MSNVNMKPEWSPRVSRHKVARLYEKDAQGIRDEELVDDVGYGLLLRVESCLTATLAMGGKQVQCPNCNSIRGRNTQSRPEQENLHCENCSWTLPWAEYHKSYRGKRMGCAGLNSFFQDFKDKFPMREAMKRR